MELLRSLTISDLEPFLANPTQLNTQPVALQLAVASYSQTPRPLLEVLVNSPHLPVAEAAQLHINWAGEISEDGQNAVEEVLKSRYLGQNDKLAVELLKIAPVPPFFLSEWVPNRYLIQALSNPYLPLRYHLKLLERLAKEPTLEPRLQVAESPEAPLAILESLAGDLELAIRLAVQHNPVSPPELVRLVEGQHEIASDCDTNAEQLANLAQSRWDWIRLAVAQNPSTPEETLLALAEDKVLKIRFAVAKNSVASAHVLAVLAASDQEIQAVVAGHDNANEEILHRLFATQQGIIKNRSNLPVSILERIFNEAQIKPPLWDRKNSSLRDLFFKQPNTPTWILERFADVDVEAIRQEKAALRPDEPELVETWTIEALDFLVDIAKHPQVSREILERLAEYPNANVQLAVAQNTKAPEELRLQLLADLVTNSSDRIKVKIAENANTPITILEQLLGKLLSLRQKIIEISQTIPNFSLTLLDTVLDFFNRYQSPEQILFWLRQDAAFREPILRDWDELINALDEQQKQQLTAIGGAMLPAIGLNGGVPSPDRVWLKGSPFDAEQKISSNYVLYGLLLIIGMLDSNDQYKALVIALLGNPSIPNDLRDRLWQKYRKQPDSLNRHSDDASLRLALGFNSAVPELERLEYLQQALSSPWKNIKEAIAKHPDTPVAILEQIAQQGVGGLQQILKNPNAPVHLLEQAVEQIENSSRLSHTLVDVAKNPNTPIDLLKKLALNKGNYGVSQAVLTNPHLDDLTGYKIQLELQKREEASQATQLLASRPNSPHALAQVIETGDQKAKITVACSNKTPIQVLEQLAKDADENVRLAVVQNPNTPLNGLLELARDTSYKVRIWLARSRHPIPKDVLLQLIQSSDARICTEIANNSNTPPDILRGFVEDSDRNVKISALKNPNLPSELLSQAMSQIQNENEIEWILRGQAVTDKRNSQMPADVLEQLSRHPKDTIRYLVATYRTAATTTLERLAFDKYELVRDTVAGNPNTPPNILLKMARYDALTTSVGCYHRVSHQIAVRHDAPPEVLEFIARIPESRLRAVVAANANTPSSALKWLAENEVDESVLCVLVRHQNMILNIWMELARHESVRVREAVASQSHCPSEILTILVDDSTQEVQQKVAANSSTPIHVVERFSKDDNPTIRTAAASNSNLPATILTQLANDQKVEVRRAVAQNPNTPAPIRETLRDLVVQPTTRQTSPTLRGLNRLYNPETDDLATVLSEYAESDVPFVRFVTLLHPLMPVEVLQQGAQSASWLERYAVADNPATPTEIKQQLAEDSNQIVRAVAMKSLA